MKHNHQHSESMRFKQNQRKIGVIPQGNLNFISFMSLLDPQWSANLQLVFFQLANRIRTYYVHTDIKCNR